MTYSEADSPMAASGTPAQAPSFVREHLDHPVDGCPLSCCRITFDHRRDFMGFGNVTAPVTKTCVWNWERSQWQEER